MIEVVCVCKKRFEVQDEHAGLSIKCPECRRLVNVPGPPPGPVPDTIPPPGLLVDPAAMATSPEVPRSAPAEIPPGRYAEVASSVRDLDVVRPIELEPLVRLCRTI